MALKSPSVSTSFVKITVIKRELLPKMNADAAILDKKTDFVVEYSAVNLNSS